MQMFASFIFALTAVLPLSRLHACVGASRARSFFAPYLRPSSGYALPRIILSLFLALQLSLAGALPSHAHAHVNSELAGGATNCSLKAGELITGAGFADKGGVGFKWFGKKPSTRSVHETYAPNRVPTFRIGDSDGGPGAWTRVNESMSDAQRAHQQRVMGAPNGTAYNVADSNVASGRTIFDGYNPQTNTLIDVKCWLCWPNNSLGFSNQSVVDQAFRQQRIAQQTGRTVEWHVPDQAAATRVQNAFGTASQSQRIDPNTIRIVVSP